LHYINFIHGTGGQRCGPFVPQNPGSGRINLKKNKQKFLNKVKQRLAKHYSPVGATDVSMRHEN